MGEQAAVIRAGYVGLVTPTIPASGIGPLVADGLESGRLVFAPTPFQGDLSGRVSDIAVIAVGTTVSSNHASDPVALHRNPTAPLGPDRDAHEAPSRLL